MGIELSTYLGPYIEVRRTKKSLNYFDVVAEELFEIETDDPGRLLLAPNVRREGAPREDVRFDNAMVLDLERVSPSVEMDWLRSAFTVEISALEKAYKKVTIRWGLCQWWQ